MTRTEHHDRLTRRRALAAGVSLAAAIAGCLGDGGSADESAEANESGGANETDDASGSTEANDSDESDDMSDSDDANESTEANESDGGEGAGSEGEGASLELLVEESIDLEHACLHAEFDDRIPLEAGGSPEEAPTVAETHTVWEVTYEDEGYVSFDVDAHEHDGSFVFYTTGGTATPVVGSEEERDSVSEEDCTDLGEYVVVAPEDGALTVEVTGE